ncbi:MAG: 30S ribosome-binding factor RbfA [Anaerorhabdus sp.]
MALKVERLNQIVLKEVTEIIQFQLKDPSIGFVTITDVEVTNDYSYAKIYVSFLGKKERNEAGLKALQRSKGFIRSELAKKLTIRKIPDLIFKLDETFEKSRKIDEIITQIHKDENEK